MKLPHRRADVWSSASTAKPRRAGRSSASVRSEYPKGIYEGDIEPSAGGSLTLQVLADGQGIGARQTTFDEPNYSITFADIDDGIQPTVPGCST